MLTYNERSWLAWKNRISQMKIASAAWCHKCPHLGRNAAGCYGEPYCPLFPDFADAAEFSERVAAKLARWDNEYHGTATTSKYCKTQTLRQYAKDFEFEWAGPIPEPEGNDGQNDA